MAQRHIMVDKTEIVLMVAGKKKYEIVNLSYDQIVRVQFDKCKETRFFWRVESESITIITSKRPPIVYKKFQEKNFFDEYKNSLEKFCKDNHITFTNNLIG